MLDGKDRRQFQRFDLETPIRGRLGTAEVYVRDIGILGSLISHDAVLEVSDKARLVFVWEGASIELESEVVYSSGEPFFDPEATSRTKKKRHSGLRFHEAVGDSDEALRKLIAHCAKKALGLDAARALVFTETHTNRTALEDRKKAEAAVGATGFRTYRFERSAWRKTTSDHATQPSDGFTVPVGEDDDHVQLLCRAFESAGEDGRKSIRALAELSVSQAKQLPPRAG
ncbi:MAG TPA: hypothetical protein VNM92_13095 [Thermoanaerobaculia bacterium]|nr:hypothetical protein [Thermoanaerobaculia bacterium]